MNFIDIKGIDRAELLAALYNGTRALGMGILHDLGRDMTAAEASEILSQSPSDVDFQFDYVMGRPIKVAFQGEKLLRASLYDRDSLVCCEEIVARLKDAPHGA